LSLELPDDVALMPGETALPRDNGELVFAAPWEARAVAVAVALVQRLGLTWDVFRARLVAAIAACPNRPYYESWAVALEDLVVGEGLASADALDAATPTERTPL
jgi:nitrile hydratase accessory protein